MQPAVLIRLRPSGPWRYGPGEGGQERLDALYRSDRLFSAVTIAMKQLGHLDDWLNATVQRSRPAVALTSLFPFQGDTLYIAPPSTVWPPAHSLITAPSATFLAKIRWSAARFVPVTLVESLLLGQKMLADQWTPDPQSGCLLRRDRPNTTPFYSVVRRAAAVDRLNQNIADVHTSACIEFEPASGLWTTARFADEGARDEWFDRIQAAFRLLADTGFGGRRSSGWGQTQAPVFEAGTWPGLLFPKVARVEKAQAETATNGDASLYWLLSLYSPAANDPIEWSEGSYQIIVRGGYVEGGGVAGQKKNTRMVAEGSVVASKSEPLGAAHDVAPEGAGHPAYRAGFAVALRLPEVQPEPESLMEPVETPTDPEAPQGQPCEVQPEAEQSSPIEESPEEHTEVPEMTDSPEGPRNEPSEESPEPVREAELAPEMEPQPDAGMNESVEDAGDHREEPEREL